MIKPKRNRNLSERAHTCECRPVCKNRRLEWKDDVQKTSAELLLEREPKTEYLGKYPKQLRSDSPCPVSTEARYASTADPGGRFDGVTVCETPIADVVPTPYLKFAEMARQLGAWNSVKEKCAFCSCSGCCLCSNADYALQDEEPETRRCSMRDFDERVKTDSKPMRIMYKKLE